MPQLIRHDEGRYTCHQKAACIGVTQLVKDDSRVETGVGGDLAHSGAMTGDRPGQTIDPSEHQLLLVEPARYAREELDGLIGQNDIAAAAGLGCMHEETAGLTVECGSPHRPQFADPAACVEARENQRLEITRAGGNQSRNLILVKDSGAGLANAALANATARQAR